MTFNLLLNIYERMFLALDKAILKLLPSVKCSVIGLNVCIITNSQKTLRTL